MLHPGILYALAAAVSLGAITTQAKLFYADGGNAISLMLVRFAFASLTLGLIVFIRGGGFAFPRHSVWGVSGVGMVWSVSMICYLLSVQTLSVSLAVLILYLFPVLVLVFGILSGRIRPALFVITVFLLAFAGLVLAIWDQPDRIDSQGVLFAALAAIGAAVTFVTGRHVASRIDPILMTFWVSVIGLIILLPFVPGVFSQPTSFGGVMGLTGATVCYAIAVICQFQALSKLPAEQCALFFNIEPLVSLMLAFMILGERLQEWQWVGVILVLTAITLNSWRGRQVGNAN